MARLFLLFTLTPLVELFVLIRVGKILGFWPIFLIIIGTVLLGIVLVMAQGQYLMRRFTDEVHQGQLPADSLFHALVVFVGGVLFIVPGFLTDLLGAVAVFPLTRVLLVRAFKKSLAQQMAAGRVVVMRGPGFRPPPRDVTPPASQQIVDVSPSPKNEDPS